jgi:putative oxidoreductase
MSFTSHDAVLFLGRLLLGGLFVYGGVIHFFQIPKLVAVMTARGVPMPRETLIVGSLFQIVAGLLLIFGPVRSWGAYGLVLFTLASSVMFMNFWDLQGPAREGARNMFFTNLALVGGLLIAAV